MNATAVTTLFPQLLIRRARANSVARFHDFIEVTTPAPTPAYERRDLATLLRLVTWVFSTKATQKNIALRVDAPVAGLIAVCDEVRLQRVLENLVENAITHAPVNSIVTLAARQDGAYLRFSVDDEGPGVAVDKAAKLFDTEHNDEDSGLTVCHRIVNAHGGQISTHNLDTGGARFEFTVPAAIYRHQAANPTSKVATFTDSASPEKVEMRTSSSHAA